MNLHELDGLSSIVSHYDVFLVDAWGVLHDGKSLYPGAGELLDRLIKADKKVVILSNAARRIADFKTELLKVGVSSQRYTEAITSGELCHQALVEPYDVGLEKIGNHYFYQGPERSRGILKGLDLEEVELLADAGFIINTGAEGNVPDASGFVKMLSEAQVLGLPMLCANPDRVAIRGGVMGISAGAIAYQYEQMGGKVVYFGKPHLPIYQRCFKLFPQIDRSAFVMLGDGLPTDIRGANQAGIDSVFLSSGIHQVELSGADAITLDTLFDKYRVRPTYTLSSLS